MPLEIRELVIKINVESGYEKPATTDKDLNKLKAAIVKECTAAIMANIKAQRDR
ncbi:hypothetical protein HH214_10160 [Mucilaginibacter robiniae]|uniref:Uncharacterized protein n=1 Tax=Mucilaginibacter robiniae TaxID=2728022 RepID=A0A7L5E5S0_9SPHI|nr:DUF5908 family protein [Mucilaginibacter robiniae]QJD96203.1 hypothetical protein HH214_10160 [Mucilaginibacter robiniae]